MKLSIIVPVYKVEEYVDSLLSQTIDDYEIILVDDGSPDNWEDRRRICCGKPGYDTSSPYR